MRSAIVGTRDRPLESGAIERVARARPDASARAPDEYWRITTVLGPAYVAHNERGISAVRRAETATAFERRFESEFRRPVRPAPDPPAALARAVQAYLEGRLSVAEAREALPFDLRTRTAFEQAVLLKTAEIPYGEVRPYSWLAREVGRPLAVRAVGSAVGRNPVPLLIPCHRVIRRDGRIGEYGLGGQLAKRTLLAAEGVAPDWLERLAREGIRYVGDASAGRCCFPTCQNARRIPDRDRIALGSDSEARALGFRACEACRPF